MKPLQPLFLLLLLGCIGGCGSSQNDELVREANDTNIKKMGSAYQLYASRSGYVGPRSKEELEEFLLTNESITKNLKLMGLDRSKIAEYFISENDGEEFDFRWGVFINPDIERSREPLIFEKTGIDGVRLVLLSNRKLLEVDNNEKYQELLKGLVRRDDAKTELQLQEEAAAE